MQNQNQGAAPDPCARRYSHRAEGLQECTSNILARLDRMEGDSGTLKGYFVRNETVADAGGIAEDMGLAFIRTLTGGELRNMCRGRLDGSVSEKHVQRQAGWVRQPELPTGRPGHRGNGRDGNQIHGNGDFVHGQPARLHRSNAKRRTADPVHRQTGRAGHRRREERSRSPRTGGLRKSPLAPAGGQNARPGVKLGRSGQHQAHLQVSGTPRGSRRPDQRPGTPSRGPRTARTPSPPPGAPRSGLG